MRGGSSPCYRTAQLGLSEFSCAGRETRAGKGFPADEAGCVNISSSVFCQETADNAELQAAWLSLSAASRLPILRRVAMASSWLRRGRVLPSSHL